MVGDAVAIVGAVVVLLIALVALRTIRIVPQARARNVERFGRYRKTLEPGLNFVIPGIDRLKPLIDLREQVVSFLGQPVITEDNLVVRIDTVLFFQVTDPRAADYEIVNYIQAIEQLTATMLRSVIGSMDLEVTLTSRDKINTMLRGVLDDASGKWGIRVTRVEIKAIDPPKSVIDAMEKQMRAEREKRAAVLNAEGLRQAQILTAEGDKQGTVLRAEGDKQSAILRAEGQATAIQAVFQSIHDNDPDPKLLAYQYLQTLPQLSQGPGNTVWMIPSELTSALKMLSSAFDRDAASAGAGGGAGGEAAAAASGRERGGAGAAPGAGDGREVPAGPPAAWQPESALPAPRQPAQPIPAVAPAGVLSSALRGNGAASGLPAPADVTVGAADLPGGAADLPGGAADLPGGAADLPGGTADLPGGADLPGDPARPASETAAEPRPADPADRPGD